MLLYPQDLYQKLEFDKIQEQLATYCMGAPAKRILQKVRLFTHKDKVEMLLDEIVEMKLCKDLQKDFPLAHYESVLDQLGLLKKVDYVLDVEDYLKIFSHQLIFSELNDFFKEKEHQEKFPLLYKIQTQLEYRPELLQSFFRIFSEDGKIKPTASPELKKIFDAISSKERELERVFKTIAAKYKKQGFLSDNVESFKNSRRVLSVNAESKRKVQGILHDESSTGKTVFIEPAEVTELNNDLFELEAKKRNEVYKVLKSLSALLRPYIDDLLLTQRIIVRFDIIQAKALFANAYNGQKPKFTDQKHFEVKEIYHPYLKIINESQQKKTIPYDLALDQDQRLLVISGPNAGGKTVALKALGLCQLMLQAGMLIPVQSNSEMRLFNKIMIDIGDQQSIEGDLSTYSSRLMNMKFFVEKADKNTLVLIDEFGSGSDPKVGGAIAEGVLHQLIRRKCMGIITTHYSNIKNYAYKAKSILNGAMLFDKDELKPTYKLKLGQPGSSFAFEIANKIGMPKEILSYARKKAGKNSKTIDQLLIDLQHEKKVLEDKLLENFDESHRLNRLIKNYEQMKDDLVIKKKRLKLEAKEKSYLNLSDYEKELQKIIKDLKKEKDLERATAKLNEIKSKRQEERSTIKEISNQVFAKEIEQVKDIKVGQFVKLRAGGDSGKVVSFDDKKVKLQIGIMSFEVPRNEIILADQPIETKSRSILTDTATNPQTFESKLDIRGYSKMEAMDSIQEFFDNALLGSDNQLKILHGKGTGVLKKVVWKKAKEYKDFVKIWHPEEEFGGHGVTLISL